MEKMGLYAQNKAVFEWLSEKGGHEIRSYADMTKADKENLTEAFIDYMNKGEAPNIVTKNIFQRTKEWIIEQYKIHKTKASKEIREYFDNLISEEGSIPDMSALTSRVDEIKEILRQAKSGEEVSFNGLGKQEVRNLKKAINTRIRRKGKTLREEIIEAGGIKEGTELANSLGFDVLKKDKMFSNKEYAFEREDELIEFLAEKGFITPIQEEDDYKAIEDRWSEVQRLIDKAGSIYSNEEAMINEQRETALQNQAYAMEIVDDILKDNSLGLKDVVDLDNLLSKIVSRKDNVDIVKVNSNALKYLDIKLKELNKEFNRVLKVQEKDLKAKAEKQLKEKTKELKTVTRQQGKDLLKANEKIRALKEDAEVKKIEQKLVQQEYIDFIRNQPMNGEEKTRLLSKVSDIKNVTNLLSVVKEVKPQIESIIEREAKHLIKKNIEHILKTSKPTKQKKQKFTYRYNTLFEELRDINKLTKKEAEIELEKIYDSILSKEGMESGFDEDVRIKNLMLQYKAKGMDASLSSMKNLSGQLSELYYDAILEKFNADEKKGLEKKERKDEFVTGIQGKKPRGKFAQFLMRNNSLYSQINEIAGKKMADKYNLEVDFEEVNIKLSKSVRQLIGKAQDIYGIDKGRSWFGKSSGEGRFLNKMQEMSQEDLVLIANDGVEQKISKLEVMDIYLGMKNKNTKANYLANYEAFDETMPTDKSLLRQALESMSDEDIKAHQLSNNLDVLMSSLSSQDLQLADVLQEEVNKTYEIENKYFIKKYGIDLPKVENYFPRSSRSQSEYDVLDDYKYRSDTPSSMKYRSASVIPVAKNVWTKYQEHIAKSAYIEFVAEKYQDLRDILKDHYVKSEIEKQYGKNGYNAIWNNVKDLSISGSVKTYMDFGNSMQQLLNNLVVGQVALNVPMAIKQLPSFINYSVDMPKEEFSKNVVYMLSNWDECIDFIREYAGDFIDARYYSGSQAEAVGRALKEASLLSSKKYPLNHITKPWKDMATWFIRNADKGAIYLGGYAKLKYMVDKGMTKEEIRKDFIRVTLRNQSAGNPATLASFQRDKSIGMRFLTAFRNVPAQYMRLLTDTQTQYQRGEISKDRYYSNLINYVVLQPVFYVLIGNMLAEVFGDDEDKEWYDGMLTEMALTRVAGIPIVSDLARFGLDMAESKITGKDVDMYDAIGVYGIQQINRSLNKLRKKNPDVWDWANIGALIADMTTGGGFSTVTRYGEKIFED
jgi:hypothetical protein